MTQLIRVRTLWNVPGGGAGLSVMHFRHNIEPPGSPTNLNAAVRNFFNTLASLCPDDVQWNWESELAFFGDEDGEIAGYSPATQPAALVGTQTDGYAAPAGIGIRWMTDAVIRGRRLAGRTFLVPVSRQCFETNGTLVGTNVTTVLAAAASLRTAAAALEMPMRVWSRPLRDEDGDIIGPGSSADVTGHAVPDKVVVLRSRRD